MRQLAHSIVLACLFGSAATAETFSVDVWADNWFAFYVNGVKVAEDHVPITIERSFNSESFSFTENGPFVIGLIAKDFKENDTGLEYIGTRKQQMGDGGLIVQVKDTTGKIVAASGKEWRCMVIHEAPLNKSCPKDRNPVPGKRACGFEVSDEPYGWGELGFDDSSWSAASAYSERDVRPKDGYDRIRWDRNARLIWGPDLETNNTILCRVTVR